jgi:hypothetical protein
MQTQQLSLEFDGPTYAPDRDGARLRRQLTTVWEFMCDQHWATLPEIAEATGYPEASISARLRDLRKVRFGGHTVHRHCLGKGLWEYKVVPNPFGSH